MKMNVSLTADEMLTLMDAVIEAADERGYEVERDDIQLELFEIMDAGLASLGIEIVEDEDEDEDEEIDFDDEDENEDEKEVDPIEEMIYVLEGKRVISKSNARMLIDMMADVVKNDNRVPPESKGEFAQLLFIKFCSDKGIWGVDNRGE